ncbi:MAG: TonB-dependent receptor plug domain-containing protein, partial [Gammaproteobacteria bacterium]|nr:TonB-dependent receptor plug domain-containing protein [Gammaproteobacteria bacterium]
MLNRCTFLFLALLSMQSWAAPLTEIVVTAELLESSPLEIPNSVSVVDAQAIEQRSARHLEDLLNMAPNVNFASGASRGRFVQIRGIGERSEFQEPIINSVGILVDGIDLTGIATAASTLDLKQVEVLRGPQGTLHGANALAGLINMVSNVPTDQFESSLNVALEEFGGRQLGGVLSGPINDQTAYRIAVNHFASDGFVDNVFLNRADTNNIDETAARLRL